VNAARDILQQLSAVGARIERRDERLVICTGRRPVPPDLIAAARSAKPDLLTVLSAGAEGTHPAIEDAQQKEGEHLRCAEAENRRIPAALVEDAHANAFDERLRAEPAKMLSEDAHGSTFDKPEDFCAFQVSPASKLLNSPSLSAFDESEDLRREWSDAEEERAALAEHDGKIPRAWAEGYARLHPDHPPGDVPLRRWQTFVDDCGRFLEAGWGKQVAALGWGPLDLFGCDRERPFARVDHAGLLWLVNGDKLIELDRHTALIERPTGARQIWRRRPSEPGQVLTWELAL
jgi:hypothetical protein